MIDIKKSWLHCVLSDARKEPIYKSGFIGKIHIIGERYTFYHIINILYTSCKSAVFRELHDTRLIVNYHISHNRNKYLVVLPIKGYSCNVEFVIHTYNMHYSLEKLLVKKFEFFPTEVACVEDKFNPFALTRIDI